MYINPALILSVVGVARFGFLFFAFSAFTDIYTDALLLVFFLGFLVPSSGASRPGRRLSHAVSRRFFFVFGPGTQTRNSPSSSSLRFSFNYRRRLSYFRSSRLDLGRDINTNDRSCHVSHVTNITNH